jgi:hypothetical protein
MKFILKIKIFAILAVVLVVVAAVGLAVYKPGFYGSLAGYWSEPSWSKPERGQIMDKLLEMKEINRLYTGSYLVPVLDVSYGYLKRDLPQNILGHTIVGDALGVKPPPMVPKGYCLKKFEVGFGYDQVLDLLKDENFLGRVCAGDWAALPDPALLSVNCTSTEVKGDYRGNCRDWDQNPQLRQKVVYRELRQGETFKKITENGRKSLQALASPLCP